MTKKLTPAQAYAAQVRADRRAEAINDRRDPAIVADNARINAMYGNAKVAPVKKTKKVTAKRVAWTSKELDLLINLYLKHVDAANGSDNRETIVNAFSVNYPDRSVAAAHLMICQIKQLDAYYPAQGMTSVSDLLRNKLYSVDSIRFPGGATKEDKIVNALDNLLAEIRG